MSVLELGLRLFSFAVAVVLTKTLSLIKISFIRTSFQDVTARILCKTKRICPNQVIVTMNSDNIVEIFLKQGQQLKYAFP